MPSEFAKLVELDIAELTLRAAELRKEMYDLRLKLTTKEQSNTARLRDGRRDYARVLTAIRRKQLAAK